METKKQKQITANKIKKSKAKTIKTIFEKNKDEIKWNLINSVLIGAVAFLSSILSTGDISLKSLGIGFITFLLITVTKFKDYWTNQENEYKNSWTTKDFNIL